MHSEREREMYLPRTRARVCGRGFVVERFVCVHTHVCMCASRRRESSRINRAATERERGREFERTNFGRYCEGLREVDGLVCDLQGFLG